MIAAFLSQVAFPDTGIVPWVPVISSSGVHGPGGGRQGVGGSNGEANSVRLAQGRGLAHVIGDGACPPRPGGATPALPKLNAVFVYVDAPRYAYT